MLYHLISQERKNGIGKSIVMENLSGQNLKNLSEKVEYIRRLLLRTTTTKRKSLRRL